MSDGDRGVSVARRKLENEMFTFEGEKRSYEKKREDILAEMARAHKDILALESTIDDLKVLKNNYDHRIFDAEEEIARIKRKMNLL
jgi:predicted  nucleic acid-binding Zn-ribbon protein